jgi:cell division protein FtsX
VIRVESYRFFDHNDAYREFKKLFSDQPTIVEGVSPAGLPTSFRVILRRITDATAVDHDYHAIPGVKQINSPASICSAPKP